jgi:ferric-dicitrate binding protein FerR (iron transport regulator)
LQQQAIEWLIRLRTHELTEAETIEFADWLSHDLSHTEAFANAEDLFEVMTHAVQMKMADAKPNPNSVRKPAETINTVDLSSAKPYPAGEGWVTTTWMQEVGQRRERLPRGNKNKGNGIFESPPRKHRPSRCWLYL